MRPGRAMGWTLLLASLPALFPAVAGGQVLTPVAVHGKVQADRFRGRFEARLTEVEARIAKQFSSLLAREVGFLSFAVGDTVARYHLVFTLDRRERGVAAAFPEFGFWVSLERPAEQPLELYWLPFRTSEQATAGVGTVEAFLGELGVKLTHADVAALRDSLLNKVPIAREALTVSSPLGWALALPRLDLCIKNKSQLEVLSELASGAMVREKSAQTRVVGEFHTGSQPTSETQPFIGGTFSEPTDQATMDEWTRILNQPGMKVRVKEVYVRSPVHDPNACRDRGEGTEEGGSR